MNINKYYAHLPDFIKNIIRFGLHLTGRYRRKSYSQEGEDILLSRLLEGQKTGFYVDVGAHHPSRCSNTYHFYKSGWRGINIDAIPNSMNLFNLIRPRDINIEMAISDKPQILTFHTFNNPLFNSADPTLAQERRKLFNEEQSEKNTFQVRAETLRAVLDKHMPSNTAIDFMTIDVEGLDLKVLQSNNWEKYRPKYLLVEILGQSIKSLPNSEIYKYLENIGYEPISKLAHTVIFSEKYLAKIDHK